MNKFTKASIKLYEKWRSVLPEMYNRLDNLRHLQNIHFNNPFIDQTKVRNDIEALDILCERGYLVFAKLQKRLSDQGLCGTDPWSLVKKKKK